ncbi:glycosyltransferase family 2 protein [Alloyangia pacifica]|uniref:glycosyltransferase family 2 protein n=1 Tax=Alloyangia pacifica TaxID=311180 RepID=UPI001CFE5E92|nr:glycosyltransferase family 2 protein [Alloyangia pacifica]
MNIYQKTHFGSVRKLSPQQQCPLATEVLVVIPTLNEAGNIEACIRSLVGSDGFMRDVRIVVADGGSTDGTQAIVHALAQKVPQLRMIKNHARLQSSGINIAVASEAEAEFSYMVRCDAHSIYPEGYVRKVAEALSTNPEAASVASVMDAAGDNPFQRACAWVVDTPLGSGGSAHRGGNWSGWVDHGHHAGFRLDWFNKINGYDPSFSHNEDAEYDHRLGLAGGRVWLDASIRLQYEVRPTPRSLLKQYWNYGRGRARTVLKHRMRPRLRQLVPVLNLLAVCVSMLVATVWPVALLLPLHYLLTLLTVSGVCAHSLRSRDGLQAGLALAIMHNAWALGFLWQCAQQQLARLHLGRIAGPQS